MKAEKYWELKQKQIDRAIDTAIERAKVDTDILKTMKEMLNKARLKERRVEENEKT
jgi:hypothetical protein